MFRKSIPLIAVALSIASMHFAMSAFAGQSKSQNVHTQTEKQKKLQPTATAKKKKNVRKPAPVSIALGKKLYKQYQCFDCHSIAGKGCENGMKLDSIGSKRTKDFIREHIADPDKHFDKNPKAFDADLNLMPPQNLEPYEIDSLVEYLHSLK